MMLVNEGNEKLHGKNWEYKNLLPILILPAVCRQYNNQGQTLNVLMGTGIQRGFSEQEVHISLKVYDFLSSDS